MRLDSGETSEWFAVEQGLRQGCVIAPDLFNIFFVAVLTVAFDRFSIDKAVLDDFVRVVARGDLTKGGSQEGALDHAVRRRRWHRLAISG